MLINDAVQPPSLWISTVVTSDFEAITAASIITLAQDDVLTLALFSLEEGYVLFGPGLNVSLNVMRIGRQTEATKERIMSQSRGLHAF